MAGAISDSSAAVAIIIADVSERILYFFLSFINRNVAFVVLAAVAFHCLF